MILTRNTMKQAGKGAIEVLVETGTSRDNVSRLARKESWQVEVIEVEERCIPTVHFGQAVV